jgi:hypothetical protein
MLFKQLAGLGIATIWDHLGWFRPGNVPVLFPNFFAFHSLSGELGAIEVRQ